MNAKALAKHYERFTPETRVRLILAAVAREDIAEAARLMTSCPQMKLVGPDPEFSERLKSVGSESANVLLSWLEVSHRVIHCRSALDLCTVRVLYESRHRVDGAAKADGTRKQEAMVRKLRARKAQAKAMYKSWSAGWKGIEAAIARFCRESDLTTDQLFALKAPLSPAIEEARGMLAVGGAADRAFRKHARELTYHNLCEAWSGDSKPK
jgi:hypothetical protein